jgi:hypothetical protein
MASELRSGHWLNPDSDEFDQVFHSLELSVTGMSSFKDIEVWKIETPDLVTRYERRTANYLKVGSWVLAENLGTENTMEHLCSQGWRFLEGGMEFLTGNQYIQPNKTKGNKAGTTTLIYSELAVGHAYATDENPRGLHLPAGFDSFYITPKPLDRNGDGIFSVLEYQAAATFEGRRPTDYSHRYYVRDSQLVCPKYIVTFPQKNIQGVSTKKPMKFAYFDLLSHRPIDMNSQQMTKDATKHVVSIDQAYEHVKEEVDAPDPLLIGKQEWIEKQLDKVEERVRAVNLNYAEVALELKEAYDKAMRRLEMLTKRKLETVLSVEIDLRRQLEQIAWCEHFIKQEDKICTNSLAANRTAPENVQRQLKLEFLKLWKSHMNYRNNLGRIKSSEKHWQQLNQVRADIRALIDIQVYCDEEEGPDEGDEGYLLGGGNSKKSKGAGGNQGPMIDFLKSAESDKYFSVIPRPRSDITSAQLIALVDNHADKIQEILEDSTTMRDTSEWNVDRLPLPASIQRVAANGDDYHLRVPGWPTPDANNAGSIDIRGQFEDTLRGILGNSTGPSTSSVSKRKPQVTSTSGPSKSVDSPRKGLVYEASPKSSLYSPGQASSASKSGMTSVSRMDPAKRAEQKIIDEESVLADSKYRGGVRMPIQALINIVSQYHPQMSLSEISKRKMNQVVARNIEGYDAALEDFSTSVILHPEDAKTVYFSLPMLNKAPNVKMMYSTAIHDRSLNELYSYAMLCDAGSLLLVRSGEYVFGAYLSHPIMDLGRWAGSPSCFMFSVTLDVKLSYHARVLPQGAPQNQTVAFLPDENQLIVGNKDLVLDSALLEGSSEMENMFGIGLQQGGPEAKTLLAGSNRFQIDDVELWAVIPGQL